MRRPRFILPTLIPRNGKLAGVETCPSRLRSSRFRTGPRANGSDFLKRERQESTCSKTGVQSADGHRLRARKTHGAEGLEPPSVSRDSDLTIWRQSPLCQTTRRRRWNRRIGEWGERANELPSPFRRLPLAVHSPKTSPVRGLDPVLTA